jgi:HD-GYP domain-containing protein (c-di-GMP phosphodiesterase class II)
VIRKAQGELVNHVGEQSEVLMASELGIQSLASVPLLIEGRCIGALTIGCKNELVEAEFRMLQALADLAASTIHRITLYEQTDRRLHRITSLQTITTALNASVDLRMTLSVLVEQVVSQMQADAVDVLLLNQHTKMLEYAAGFGFDHDFFKYSRLKLGEDFAGKAGVERRPVYVADLVKTPSRSHEDWFSAEKFISYYALPLIVNGQVKGVLETYHRHTFHNSDPEWQRFMETLAGQAAIAIDKSELMDRLKRSNEELILAYDATIEGWSNALDMRDKETEGHSRRVAAWTLRLARAMGLSGSELVHIRRGALLHDIGKVALPDNILLKPGPLTDEEWKVVRKHPEHAYQLLSGIAFLAPALDIPFGHHEKWDGSGYPRKLKGQEIPLPARIFAIIDVWDALTSDRPYRSAWPQEKALAYLASEKGKHFDPQVVDTFMDLMENGGWTPVFD